MKIKKKKMSMLIVIALHLLFNVANDVYASQEAEEILEFVEGLEQALGERQKVAYLTFDDGPTIYTEALLGILNEYEVPGIFFVLGSQFKYIPNVEGILNRIIDEGHYIALHTISHDKNALYWSEKSPARFTEEMLELRDEVKRMTSHETNLCRAPYGKKRYFKAAHYQAVKEAGLYCVDWHIDSEDWGKKNAEQIYAEVVAELENFKDAKEVVILFHELQRTVDAMPLIIEYLMKLGFTFEPYVEGKAFEGLN